MDGLLRISPNLQPSNWLEIWRIKKSDYIKFILGRYEKLYRDYLKDNDPEKLKIINNIKTEYSNLMNDKTPSLKKQFNEELSDHKDFISELKQRWITDNEIVELCDKIIL